MNDNDNDTIIRPNRFDNDQNKYDFLTKKIMTLTFDQRLEIEHLISRVQEVVKIELFLDNVSEFNLTPDEKVALDNFKEVFYKNDREFNYFTIFGYC